MDVAPKGFKRKVFLWARRQIFDAIHHVFLSEKLNNLIEIVGVKLIENATPSYVIEEHSRQTTKNVLFVLKKKWKNAHNTKNRFLEGNKSWLDDSTNIAAYSYQRKKIFLNQNIIGEEEIHTGKWALCIVQ
ncbi:uncharacterized protein LOC117172998 isoform X2 [Belonocnema kinseyi]|uniref:uncharacterized protein LOC117172998 isoform X2 n=1 Tax=Belonocnema kinseyi TaxID=2817044 RepID=UPI00143E04FE|nr:uncharacterized protein LOC117172998 isoform X2 [Belonocnema kinseyi]